MFCNLPYIKTNNQSIILSKYDNKPSAVVGFKVEQDVVTASDNSALYDNAGATINTAAPGTLWLRELESNRDTYGPNMTFVSILCYYLSL